jgi:hypothetical protein
VLAATVSSATAAFCGFVVGHLSIHLRLRTCVCSVLRPGTSGTGEERALSCACVVEQRPVGTCRVPQRHSTVPSRGQQSAFNPCRPEARRDTSNDLPHMIPSLEPLSGSFTGYLYNERVGGYMVEFDANAYIGLGFAVTSFKICTYVPLVHAHSSTVIWHASLPR